MGIGHNKHHAGVATAPGLNAKEVVDSPSPGTLGAGKKNLVQTHDVGNQWIDHDEVCSGKDDSTAGCFLRDGQRQKLIADFMDKAQTAQTNYKFAVEELRVDALLEKDSDMSWVVSLLLDVVGAHVISVVARGLSRFRTDCLAELETKILDDGARGAFDATGSAASTATLLSSVKDKTIETYVKTTIDQSKKQFSNGLKSGKNAGRKAEHNDTVSYLDLLKAQCDVGFQDFKDSFRALRNDAEMVAIWGGMDVQNHTVNAYKAPLSEKLARYQHSGVKAIGRIQTVDRFSGDADVYRDTRVIWLCDEQGNKTLWFQSQDGDVDYGVIHDGDPGYPNSDDKPRRFGPRDPREDAVLGKPVPLEFVEVAIERSEARWGPTPTIFDPALDVVNRWLGRAPAPEPPAAVQVPRLQLSNVFRHAAQDAITGAARAPSKQPQAAVSSVAAPSPSRSVGGSGQSTP